ncbi:putative LRR receptor-like serine/threonine-protein kinase [Hibiscus syriacus]|uniref:LRR receptor-like serine/threonine-protein kinase n=1 Tax=Hibiscus syriacus TaxID=106335 RepID=A0A6A3B2N8_HIBSY|nr:putative LRR receptor-like serine/threonine-protein kinase [Hibiscus syriacus]
MWSLWTSLYGTTVQFYAALRCIYTSYGDSIVHNLTVLRYLRNLHNTSLSGAIQNLGSLQRLEKLNLSYNQLASFGSDLDSLVNLRVLLKGIVPDSLGELKNLHLLNLENNKPQGTLPLSLNRESLEVRTTGNLCLSFSLMVCNDISSNPSIETPQVTIVTDRKLKRHRMLAITLGAAGGTLFALLLISLLVLLYINKRKGEATYTTRAAIDMRNWNAAIIFPYKEIKAATKNFKEVIGRGSFGSVHLLSQIHHQNLVSLEGFCHESKQQVLVYEYLPGGSLSDHLYGPKSQKMKAKVSDFGLSKQVTREDATHVTTFVKGTAGYLDPEYYSTQQLTEKSDVYSFGVVLLKLIEPLTHSGTPDSFNLVLWAKPYLQEGALQIVDDSLKGIFDVFDVESMRKAALTTVRSVERDASRRPTIAQVLAELKEAYSLQLSYLASFGHPVDSRMGILGQALEEGKAWGDALYLEMVEENSAYNEEDMNILKEILVGREKENHLLVKEVEAYRQMNRRGDAQRGVNGVGKGSSWPSKIETPAAEKLVDDVIACQAVTIGTSLSFSGTSLSIEELERNAVSGRCSFATSNKRLEIGAKIEHLTERLQIVQGEKEKLTSSADQREMIDIPLKHIEEQVCLMLISESVGSFSIDYVKKENILASSIRLSVEITKDKTSREGGDVSQVRLERTMANWSKSSLGLVKGNVDGAVFYNDSTTATGGVLRNDQAD